MAATSSKKAKLDPLPICPFGRFDSCVFTFFVYCVLPLPLGSKCYRKNPAHFKEFSHETSSTAG